MKVMVVGVQQKNLVVGVQRNDMVVQGCNGRMW
jgi:hypothetical protein